MEQKATFTFTMEEMRFIRSALYRETERLEENKKFDKAEKSDALADLFDDKIRELLLNER